MFVWLIHGRASVHDVSDWKQRVVEHQGRLSRVHQQLDSCTDGIVVVDVHGFITSVNATTTRLFGYTTEEMVRGSLSELGIVCGLN